MHDKHDTKTKQASFTGKNAAISSMTNNMPPIGAEKAEVIPHAAPADIKSRMSLGFRNVERSELALQRRVRLRPVGNPAPMREPMWIIGPSAPTGRPEVTANMHDSVLTIKLRMLNIRGNMMPFKYAITSGTPLPAALGITTQHSEESNAASVLHTI
ncbi:hypothetical protein DQ04_05121040 [Trypanosoma grayi]|uniref:hypothetical protein n=1 Tax=Trypanosoma grayi TaxID=71804 RepID=UPI0004F4AA89|nr:hypothetical protein DQ04_05121040 [Trypanosoma grayi]KEG09496.1 hypothetical protein DQ04_05121040 [Trypanosoma grayi]